MQLFSFASTLRVRSWRDFAGWAQVDILHWQAKERLPRHVFLYLDRPELLAARLRQRDGA